LSFFADAPVDRQSLLLWRWSGMKQQAVWRQVAFQLTPEALEDSPTSAGCITRAEGGTMMRLLAIWLVLMSQWTLRGVGQQAASTGQPAEVFCTFDDGKQMKVQYQNSSEKHGEEFRDGKLWEPGGSPMFLFTETALTLGSSVIPEGAYSLYVVPEKQNWILVVNRSTAARNKYDEKRDLVRASMQTGQIESPVKRFQVAIAHVGLKQCNLRLYYGKVGAWAEFRER
jgi:hypothetical protein